MCPPIRDKQLSIIKETVKKSKNAICVIDKDHHVSFCNETMGRVLGIDHQHIVGRHQDDVMLEAHRNKTGIRLGDLQISEWLDSVKYHQNAMEERVFVLHTADNEHYQFYRLTLSTGEHVILGTNITELIQTQEQLSSALLQLDSLARTCDLTGVYNRRHLFESASKEFARAKRYRSLFSVVFIDVDHFKQVNDNFGHAIGDKAIIHVANTIQSRLRNTDMLGRIGGEEFAVLLPDTNEKNAMCFAERLRKTLSETRLDVDNNTSFYVTASFGVSEYTDTDQKESDVFSRADDALYDAKKSGRNKVCVRK